MKITAILVVLSLLIVTITSSRKDKEADDAHFTKQP
jgi:hypothetical protein